MSSRPRDVRHAVTAVVRGVAETERVRKIYNKTAARYDKQMGFWEKVLFGGGRQWACSQADGDVLEIAVGTGRNLAYYPPGALLTGVELSPEMVEIARERAAALGLNFDLLVGDAQELDLPDESFDAVVCTFSLCTIPDDRKAVAEARRVLRTNGRLILLEHVRSPIWLVRAGQRMLEPLTLRFEADHLTREPLDYLEAEGFRIEELGRSKWGIVERLTATKSG